MNFLKKLWQEEEGQGLTEYAIIVAALVVVIVAAITIFGEQINTFVSDIKLKSTN
ncbi:MAG: Flp family type IVb pilin [Syntrophomonadaceae bacterium]|nr:Flp family type IVb pilin [Syntrophomonadaceae bacterium]